MKSQRGDGEIRGASWPWGADQRKTSPDAQLRAATIWMIGAAAALGTRRSCSVVGDGGQARPAPRVLLAWRATILRPSRPIKINRRYGTRWATVLVLLSAFVSPLCRDDPLPWSSVSPCVMSCSVCHRDHQLASSSGLAALVPKSLPPSISIPSSGRARQSVAQPRVRISPNHGLASAHPTSAPNAQGPSRARTVRLHELVPSAYSHLSGQLIK